MPTLILLLFAMLLIPAGLAGISSGISQLLLGMHELAAHWNELTQAAAPLWPACQSLICIALGGLLLAIAAGLIAHGLKSRA